MYYFLNEKFYKEIEFFYKMLEVSTDIGFISEDYIKHYGIQPDYKTVDITMKKANSDLIMGVYFYTGSKVYEYQRTYLKILNVVADVGGTVEFFYLISFLLLGLINERQINFKIMNQIYDFNLNKTTDDPSFLLKRISEHINKSPNMKRKFIVESVNEIPNEIKHSEACNSINPIKLSNNIAVYSGTNVVGLKASSVNVKENVEEDFKLKTNIHFTCCERFLTFIF